MAIITPLLTALIAFLIALIGSNLAGEKHKNTIKTIAFLIGILASIAAAYNIFTRFLVTIKAGEVGVVETFGKVEDKPLNPGVHLVHPLSEVTEYSTRLQDIKETVETTSKEGVAFNIDVSLQYKIDPQQAGLVYENIGTDEKNIIISIFRSLIRQITATYDFKDIYGEKRQEIAQKLNEELSKELAPQGFIIERALLREIVLPENIQTAIQEKLAAEQESQRQQFINEKERQALEFALEKERQELEFALEKAQKEAERQKIEAQSMAESQRLLGESLTEQILQLKAIEATQKLAESPNSKVIIIGGGEDQLPLIFQNP